MTRIRNFVRSSWIGRIALVPFRLRGAMGVTLPRVGRAVGWTFSSREHYNYSYDLDPLNVDYMASFMAVVTGEGFATIRSYIREIETDESLRKHVIELNAKAKERYVADRAARFGRRMGWYALVRATKPKVVVETGVDKGLGSVVLAAALMRNAAEGQPGHLFGLDINPNAGYLLAPPYNKFGEIVYGDSLKSIAKMTHPIDFFIHDSDHSANHEWNELQAIKSKLSPHALVLSDTSDITSKLLEFAQQTGREFLYFAEKPKNHWWPGDGIGVAFQRRHV
jgi:predicted O-methyltransferase YrrM